jgi:MFS family permease
MTSEAHSETIRTRIPARMDRLPWSSWHWMIVLGLGAVWILDGLEVTLVGAIGAQLQTGETLALSASQVGQAGTAYVLGACLGALLFGYLTDRLGRKRLFLVTLTVYLIAVVATAFSQTFWWFAIARFVTGLGIGGEYAAINSAIDELIPARVRGWADLAINGSFWMGAVFGGAFAYVVIGTSIFAVDVGWRVAFALGAFIALGILYVRRKVPESPRWLMTHKRAEEAERIVGSIEEEVKKRTGRHELPEADEEIEIRQRESTNFVEIGRTLFRTYPRRSLLGFTLMGTQAFIYNAVTFTLSSGLVTFFGVSDTTVPLFLIPFGIANFLGALLLGRLFDTVGRRAMIVATYTIAAVGMAAAGIVLGHGSLPVGWFMVIVCAAFFFASAAASSAYLTVSEVFPLETRAMAIAFFYALATGLGGAVGPLVFGAMINTGDPMNLMIGYLIATGLMLIAAAVELAFGVSAEQESLEDVAEPLSAQEA